MEEWMFHSPKRLIRKWEKKFAFFPRRMNDGKLIWLKPYYSKYKIITSIDSNTGVETKTRIDSKPSFITEQQYTLLLLHRDN